MAVAVAIGRSGWVAVASLGLCMCVSVSVAAQTSAPGAASAAAPSPVVPPRLVSQGTVAYPAEGQGDHVVVLAVTVERDGTVRSTRVIEGDEPFASVASGAVSAFRFEPATRDGKPISAIIRLELSFKEPERESEAPRREPANPSSAASAPPPSPRGGVQARQQAGVEVSVTGQRLAPAVSSFSRAEVRQLPGAFGDPFRAIEALPGVTPIVSGLPYYYVRGAPPGNVGYFLDGVRVPYLYHIGFGPSVVHPGMVERVDLYPGGYPSRFGRFAGGIVAGETTEPRPELHGEGNLRIFDVGAMAEAGFAGGRGTVLLGGRYSYTAAILSLIAGDVTLDYRDFQARASYDVTPSDRLSLFGFGAYDLLGERKQGVLNIAFGSEFYRLDLRHDHFFGRGSTVRTAVTLGFDQSRIAEFRNATDRMIAGRVELRHPVDDSATFRAGVDGTVDRYGTSTVNYADPEDPNARTLNTLFPTRSDLAFGAWADVVLDVTPAIEVTPGARVDVFSSGGNTVPAVDPRIAARFEVTPDVRIIHAYGLAHQPPSFVLPIPGLNPANLEGGLQTSFQTSAGVEVDLPGSVRATTTLFHNAFFDMTDAIGTNANGDGSGELLQRSQGSALGLELFVRRSLTRRLGGSLSYTLSRSVRAVGREEFPAAFDRTHVANAALAYDLGRRWRAGTRLVFYTGTPRQSSSNGLVLPPRPAHPDRGPPFYRVDVRLEKRWLVGSHGYISGVLEVQNVTLSKETFESSGGRSESIGPITIPSIGVEAGF